MRQRERAERIEISACTPQPFAYRPSVFTRTRGDGADSVKKDDTHGNQSTANAFSEREAWLRFEKAVDGAVKHGPEHKSKPIPAKRRRSGANKRKP